MAQYHKIPQNVTSYEGRIVGRFTAKQFIFLAIGAIIIFLIVNSNVGKTQKIILSLVIGGITLLFSLTNIEGRTTDRWMQFFLAAVGRPTRRIWHKAETPPAYMLPAYILPKHQRGPRQRGSQELERYLRLWRPEQKPTEEFSEDEKVILDRIRAQTKPPKPTTPPLNTLDLETNG